MSTRIVQPVVRIWRRIPLRAQGFIFVALPLLSILISAILALVGNYQRAGIEAALQRHVQMVSGTTNVLTLMVNAETGMRGYLLTRRDEFLQPYATATQAIPSAMASLQALADSEPGSGVRQQKQSQLAQIQQLIEQQMTDLAWQQNHLGTADAANSELYDHLSYGKRLMDTLRTDLTTLQAEEDQLLAARLQEINAIRQRDYLAIFLTLVVGLGTRLVAWYLFHTGVTWRIEALVRYIRSLRQGQPIALPTLEKHDALGDLEREITQLDRQIAQPADRVS